MKASPAAASAASAPEPDGLLLVCGLTGAVRLGVVSTGFCCYRFPVRDQLGRGAMDFEPGQGLAEDAAVRQRALGAGGCGQVFEAPLQTDELAESLDVAPREREAAEARDWRPTGLAHLPTIRCRPGRDPMCIR